MQGRECLLLLCRLVCVASKACACWAGPQPVLHSVAPLLPIHYVALPLVIALCLNTPLPAAAAHARLAPLPLPLLGVLLGGPLAPLLRLLLHNDRQVACWRVSLRLSPFEGASLGAADARLHCCDDHQHQPAAHVATWLACSLAAFLSSARRSLERSTKASYCSQCPAA